jgi:hypothetical protein
MFPKGEHFDSLSEKSVKKKIKTEEEESFASKNSDSS